MSSKLDKVRSRARAFGIEGQINYSNKKDIHIAQ